MLGYKKSVDLGDGRRVVIEAPVIDHAGDGYSAVSLSIAADGAGQAYACCRPARAWARDCWLVHRGLIGKSDYE